MSPPMRRPPARVAPSSVTVEQLSGRRQAFVRAYMEALDAGNVGRGSIVDAVQAAGISPDNRNAARVRASEFMRDPEVLSAIHNESIRKLNAGSALGVAVLIDLARHAKSEPVRLQAAAQLVDRSPIGPIPSRSMNLHANVTVEELLEQLDGHGGGSAPGTVIEAAFEDVTPGESRVVLEPEIRPDASIRERWAAMAEEVAQEVAGD